MLSVLQSNRLEVLASEFGRLLATPVAGALQPETVVVPNSGIARWLWLSVATQLGASANLDCVLPGTFVWRVFNRVLDDVPASSPYAPGVMRWRLHALLRAAQEDPALEGLGEWRDTADDRRRFELATHLAAQFDQYIVYRPDWIEKWRRGDEPGWQPTLWRRLAASTDAADWSVLRKALGGVSAARVRETLPPRVSVFGIPLLSPGYLDVLRWLGDHIDVHLFLPNPCREHWAHIVASRDLGRRAGIADERALYLETGNALLASWGGQARDLLDLITGHEGLLEHERFEDPGNDTLLHGLQQQILELRGPATDGEAKPVLDAGDRSVQVHVCHSARREIEVLHDQLHGLFDADPALSASDVMVLSADIETHAPYIDAVFSAGTIPYSVADRDPRRGEVLLDSFLALLELPQDCFDANAVLAVLEVGAIQRRFGLAAGDLVRIREWTRDTGVRRDLGGKDLLHCNSWRDGLDRMLLGFALPGEQQGVFSSVLPYDGIEGGDASVLGALAEFVHRLEQLQRTAALAKTPAAWADWLNRQLDRFFAAGERDEEQFQHLRSVFSRLAEETTQAGFDEVIELDLVRDWLNSELGERVQTGGFLGHGVTFGQLTAMRSVPARVLCLIGLNDGVFPRTQRRLSFDLMAREPRKGDRSRRDDDRLAFLDSLINARDVFYLSYVGRDIRDDDERPPSVVVDELIEYCQQGYTTSNGADPADMIVVQHPLHPFSRRYFDGSDPRLFSYATALRDAAMSPGTGEPVPFLDGSYPGFEVGDVIEFQELTRYFDKPSRYFLQQALQLSYYDEAESIDTSDPLDLGGLDKWMLNELAVQLFNRGHSDKTALQVLERSRFAPPGPLGRIRMQRAIERMRSFHDGLVAHLPPEPLPPLSAVVPVGQYRVRATLHPLDADGLYLGRQGKTRGRHYLGAWLHHLVLNLAAGSGIEPRTHWYSSDAAFSLAPLNPDQARQWLAQLIDIYTGAMRDPVPFFPDLAWEYCETLDRKGDRQNAMTKARKSFFGGRQRGEWADPYVQRLFGDGFDEVSFARLAVDIFGPLRHQLQQQVTT